MKTIEYLFWAYNVIWLCLVAFLALHFVRLRRTHRRLDRVERQFLEHEPPADQPPSSTVSSSPR